MPVRQPTPGPSATTGHNVLQPIKAKKRTAIDLAVDDETRHAKKHKKELGLTTSGTPDNTVPTDTHPREKDSKKKRKKKKRKSPLTARDDDHEEDCTEMKVKRATATPQQVNLATTTLLPDTLSKNGSFASKVTIRSESEKNATHEEADTSPPRVRPPFQLSSHPVTQSVVSDDDKSVNKGKGKAKPDLFHQNVPDGSADLQANGSSSSSGSPFETRLSEAQAKIAELTLQLESQKRLASRHEDNLSQLQQSLSCEICLDLLHKPFALSPCGHIVCYMCLIRWFTSMQNNNGNGNGNANANLTSQSEDIPRILGGQQATRGVYLRKRKTCPLCRAAVTDRPAEVWSIKSMVGNLVKSKLADLPSLPPPPDTPNVDAASNDQGRNKHDPWRNIFSKRKGVGLDDFALPRIYPAPPAHDEDEGGGLEDMGMYDAEDGGIYRCLDCMHEIWGGFCTNCEREYPGHLRFHIDDDDNDDDYSGSEHGHGNPARGDFLGRRLRQIWDGYLEDGGGWIPEDDEDDLEHDDDVDMYMDFRPYAPIEVISGDEEDESEDDFVSHASGSLDGGFLESGSASDSYEEAEDGRSWMSSESHDGSQADADDPYLHAHRLAIEGFMNDVPHWPFGRSYSLPPEDGSAHIEEVEDDEEAPRFSEEENDSDEHYESSFTDDDEGDNPRQNQDLADLFSEDSDAEAEAEAIAARWWGRQLRLRGRREPTVVTSDNEPVIEDDEDSDEEEAGVRSVRRLRRGRARRMVGDGSD